MLNCWVGCIEFQFKFIRTSRLHLVMIESVTSTKKVPRKQFQRVCLFWFPSSAVVLNRITKKLAVMLKCRPCRLQTVKTVQTVQTECYCFYLYLNFLVKFFAVAIWPVTGQGVKNTKWPAVPYSQQISQIEKTEPFWTIISRDPDQNSQFCGILLVSSLWMFVTIFYPKHGVTGDICDVITSWPFMRPPWKTGGKSLYALVPFWSWNTLQHYLVDVMMKQKSFFVQGNLNFALMYRNNIEFSVFALYHWVCMVCVSTWPRSWCGYETLNIKYLPRYIIPCFQGT